MLCPQNKPHEVLANGVTRMCSKQIIIMMYPLIFKAKRVSWGLRFTGRFKANDSMSYRNITYTDTPTNSVIKKTPERDMSKLAAVLSQ